MLQHWSQLVPNNYVNRHPRTLSNTTAAAASCADGRLQLSTHTPSPSHCELILHIYKEVSHTHLMKLVACTATTSAMSTFSPVGSRSSNGMRMCERACVRACVCVRNELEICTTLAYQHISSFRSMPVPQAHAHTHPQTI